MGIKQWTLNRVLNTGMKNLLFFDLAMWPYWETLCDMCIFTVIYHYCLTAIAFTDIEMMIDVKLWICRSRKSDTRMHATSAKLPCDAGIKSHFSAP